MGDDLRATRIRLLSFASPAMRAFHMSWMAFFSVFFAWFGIAPLMPVVRDDLGLTQGQIANTIVASVAGTVLIRIVIGPLCDRHGPRRVYACLLLLGSLPVMTIGLADSYTAFLLLRLAIGCIGAAFVVTQYHTSVMFAPNCVGTANATTAGWGNLGGGVTQIVMPLLLAGLLLLGIPASLGWRLAMVGPGALLFLMGIAYLRLTHDTPAGNRLAGWRPPDDSTGERVRRTGTFRAAAADPRVWALFVVYAACFGIELTINNVAALYFHDRFGLTVAMAGLFAGLFGMMNLFARTLGGYLSDRSASRLGLRGRVYLLFAVVLLEGLALIFFSRMGTLGVAVAALLGVSVLVQMAEGATFGLVPFVNRNAIGSVSGIVGAGGNAGAVAAGLLFGIQALSYQDIFLYLGAIVAVSSLAALVVRFSPAELVLSSEDVTEDGLIAEPDDPVALAKVG